MIDVGIYARYLDDDKLTSLQKHLWNVICRESVRYQVATSLLKRTNRVHRPRRLW